MKMAAGRLLTLGSGLLLACGFASAQQQQQRQTAPPPVAAPTETTASKEEQAVQQLLSKLTELSQLVTKEPQSVQHQVSQAEVMFQLAGHSKGKEREDWLKMGSESAYAAAVQAPETDPTPYQRFSQLATQLMRVYPESKVWSHVLRLEIQAEYVRNLSKQDADPIKVQKQLRDRLVAFADKHQATPEAPEALLEAASLSETMKSVDDAVRCYRLVAERYAGTPAGRMAAGRQWRLGGVGSAVSLSLPCLYAASSTGEPPYSLSDSNGRLVVLYFWSCATANESDWQSIKQLTDKHGFRGLQVVYVNLDDDQSLAREALKGKLLNGVHVNQKGGLSSETAGRLGIKALPEAMLVGPDGKLIAHSLTAGRLAAAVAEQLPGK